MPAAIDLLTLRAAEMADLVRQLEWPRYRAGQVLRWLYQRRATAIASLSDLSKQDRAKLAERCIISSLEASQVHRSADGTQKFIFTLTDGPSIETVVIPDDHRLTACLSTQVGCTLDCTFCATGRMGLIRNLHAHEIVGQVLALQRGLPRARRLTNLVFMGMGEPLANIDHVEEAVRRLTNTTWGVGISPRRITLSTAGLAPRITRVADLGVNLAVSLNATTDAQRTRLMPAANQAYSLNDVLAACKAFPLAPHRRLTFEYVLLKGENDSEEDAVRLAKLVRSMRCKINLIPFNEFPGSPFRRPSDDAVLRFQSVLTARGLPVFIRKSKGRDVLGACGQLGGLSDIRPTGASRRRMLTLVSPAVASGSR